MRREIDALERSVSAIDIGAGATTNSSSSLGFDAANIQPTASMPDIALKSQDTEHGKSPQPAKPTPRVSPNSLEVMRSIGASLSGSFKVRVRVRAYGILSLKLCRSGLSGGFKIWGCMRVCMHAGPNTVFSMFYRHKCTTYWK